MGNVFVDIFLSNLYCNVAYFIDRAVTLKKSFAIGLAQMPNKTWEDWLRSHIFQGFKKN